eukprot:CAMPEP_0117034208 /NCGR_PEP_ID=MMETSP0472-20121206/24377_1 /TAXON_ID=693140 ORGANISM="Tiarina fusus, Strain LIS" /NCGR_SAMPLE_ID=MMETSP0472 /ASSEMBLY_ACC=CAM_ASM_000603 /LENGTH=488 /DNA_ID=CAMNT_0004743325 /DNA_START=21 /DNA_END=1487 /DNA_ORIENTATION=+
MVNLVTEQKWDNSHDIVSPSKYFKEVSKTLQDLHQNTQIVSKTINKANESDVSHDIVEVRSGFVEHVKQGSPQTIDIVLDIEMADKPADITTSTPCDLAIILDISGSMSGSPLEYSKQAIIQVVDCLQDNDFLHFIVYSTTASIEYRGFMTPACKLEVKNTIMNVRTKGSTNIVDGILSATKSMFGDYDEAERPSSKRFFLFTDGVVNQGVQDEPEIGAIVASIQRNFGVNCTAFGFGADFDESLMRLIAAMGKGDYFYIDGVEDLSFKISKGLEVLQSLFAINAKLNLFAVNTNNVSVSIDSVHGYSSIPGVAAQASLGDLCYDDLRQILCSLKVESKGETATTPANKVEILQYSLNYMVLEENGTFTERTLNGNICVTFTDDITLLNEIPDSLRVATAVRDANAGDKEILKFVARRERESALEVAKGNLSILESVADIDKTGVVVHLIARAKSTITKIENERIEESLEKEVGYSAYRGSIVHRKCF